VSERIYYTDPACRIFDAVVIRSFVQDGRDAVTLDRTAFYPTSGGQPFDTGTLGGVNVVDVIDVDSEVVHLLSSPLPSGSQVHGEVNWTRRFDHMQQHTGQHVLSAAFERLAEAATVGFHLGTDTATIDLAREVSAPDITRAEDEANRVVWDDLPVAIRFVSADEAATLPLRKESSRQGTLRLIEIRGFDLSACGGTHVARTGSIGLIAVLGAERFKGGTRVTFACGGRALRTLRVLRDVVSAGTRLMSVAATDLPASIEKLQVEAREQRKQLKVAAEAVARYQGVELLQAASLVSGTRVVVRTLSAADASMLRAMAASAAATGHAVVALLSVDAPIQVVVARSDDVSIDAAAVVRVLVERFGGKGGGRADLAQGGGLTGDIRAIEWQLAGLVEEAIGRTSS
jgi:alanyl-tRNA synthetase